MRWYLKHEPAVVDGFAKVFLRLIETTLRQASPGAPKGAQFGAILFVHRFDALNSHVHFHVLVTDGVFCADPQDATRAEFHPATTLDAAKVKAVANQMRRRGLRWLVKHAHLDQDAAHEMQERPHAGGWSVDASVHLPAWDRHGLELLARYCARPALAAGRLGRLNDDLLAYRLRRPALDGRTEILLSPLRQPNAPPPVAGPCSWRAFTRIALYNVPAVAKR
jgi:hypothetical protein